VNARGGGRRPGEPTGDPDESVSDGGESRYRAGSAAGSGGRRLTVRVELVVMDGAEGEALGRRQSEAMREVLRWLAQHPGRCDP
jgi:hypothetical protein